MFSMTELHAGAGIVYKAVLGSTWIQVQVLCKARLNTHQATKSQVCSTSH